MPTGARAECPAAGFSELTKMNRRQFLFSAGGLSICGAAYPCYWEPRWFEVTEKPVYVSARGLTAPVRLLHISDLHASVLVPLATIDNAIRLGLGARPDLICVTGDFITRARGYDVDAYVSVLRRLSRAAPTFAVFGNHDGGKWAVTRFGDPDTRNVRSLVDRAGIQLLHNRSAVSASVTLIGVGDLWANEIDAAAAFAQLPSRGPRILLSHNPDSKEVLGGYPWDLMLCGHTHGGQVIIPFEGPRYAPVRDKRYVAGLKPWRDRQIHVTRGVGNVGGVRFRCRPEVSLLVLTPGTAACAPVIL